MNLFLILKKTRTYTHPGQVTRKILIQMKEKKSREANNRKDSA
jgi:hypothetical protein